MIPFPSRPVGCAALAFALGAVVGACEAAREESELGGSSERQDSAGVVLIESSEPRWNSTTEWQVRPAPVLSVGGLDAPPTQQFSFVRDALVAESSLVVAEGTVGEVRYYDLEGRHQATIGGLGEGPGEFGIGVSMSLCSLPDGSIAVTDDTRGRFHVASPERQFVSTERFPSTPGGPLWPHACLSDGSWLVAGETHQSRQGQATLRSHSIYRIGQDGRVTGELFRLRGDGTWWNPEVEDDVLLPFNSNDQALSSGLEVVVLRASDGQIEWRTREGQTRMIARPVGVTRVATSDEVDDQAFYARGLPLAELVPLYREAFADPEGNVWAQRYRIPVENSAGYDVFDREGAWLGTVELPADLTVFEIGSDYVLGTTRDSLDVPRVEIYQIEKQGQGG